MASTEQIEILKQKEACLTTIMWCLTEDAYTNWNNPEVDDFKSAVRHCFEVLEGDEPDDIFKLRDLTINGPDED